MPTQTAKRFAESGRSFSAHQIFRFLKQKRALRLVSPIVLLAAWELAADAKLVDPMFLPPLHQIAGAFVQLLTSGVFLSDAAASIYRLIAGFVVGSTAGVVAGLLIARSRVLEDLLDPIVQALRPISPIALLPVSVIYLGISDTQKIAIIAYSVFFPVIVNTYYGVRSVQPSLLNAAKTLGARKESDMLRFVVLPGALPYIFSGLRISLGISFVVIIAAEMIAAQNGLGYLILDSERVFKLDAMYVGIIAISILGLVADALFNGLRRRALPWYVERS